MSSREEPVELLGKLLKATEEQIIPLTRAGVSSGSKLFGAAILSKETLEPYTVATNNERVSPLLHGEINCIQKFFTVDYPSAESRPNPREDCIFFATHEPCSLCLSGITWAGFSQFYYLFTYEDSRDLFSIPYDIDILEEVFRVRARADSDSDLASRPLYNKRNKFFTAKSLADLVEEISDEAAKTGWTAEIERVKAVYNELSATYQEGKKTGAKSSSVWK
jgi:tRNA(Arg) A34 adenosine deaminase TadA